MTLTQLSNNIAKLIEEVNAKGIDPSTVECVATHSASGGSHSLESAYVATTSGSEWSGPCIDMEKGALYASFTLEG